MTSLTTLLEVSKATICAVKVDQLFNILVETNKCLLLKTSFYSCQLQHFKNI